MKTYTWKFKNNLKNISTENNIQYFEYPKN